MSVHTFNFQQRASRTLVHCIIVSQVRLAKMPQLQIEGVKKIISTNLGVTSF